MASYLKEDKKGIRVAFYLRVSTDEQSKSGYGIETQKKELKDMIEYKSKMYGWIHEEKWVFEDLGVSGATLDRPGFKLLMEGVKNGEFDMVAVWKIDRLSRNLTHLLKAFEDFQKNNVSFYSLKENIDFTGPIGRLTFQIFGALAEFERETIKVRTVEGKITSARMGNYVSRGVPYGYKKVPNLELMKGKTLQILPDEAEWVKRAFRFFVYDKKGYAEIAKDFTKLGVEKGEGTKLAKKHTPWVDTTITKMLQNPVYTGYCIIKLKDSDNEQQEIDVRVPSIIDAGLFQMAQARMEMITEESTRGGGKIDYLLSRKITDIETGRNFVGYSRPKGGHGYRRKKFMNSNGIIFPNLEIPGQPLDEFVYGKIEQAINNPKEFFELYKRQTLDPKAIDLLREMETHLSEQIQEQENIIFNADDKYLSGKFSEEKRDLHVNKGERLKADFEKELFSTQEKIESAIRANISYESLEAFSTEYKNNIKNLTFEEKRLLILALVEKIEASFYEAKLVVSIVFRFAHKKAHENIPVIEPKKPSDKPRDDSSEDSGSANGATDWTGTSDLLLRREAF